MLSHECGQAFQVHPAWKAARVTPIEALVAVRWRFVREADRVGLRLDGPPLVAGIAGMSTAIELRKRGVPVDLVEVDKEWRVYGAGITINGLAIINEHPVSWTFAHVQPTRTTVGVDSLPTPISVEMKIIAAA